MRSLSMFSTRATKPGLAALFVAVLLVQSTANGFAAEKVRIAGFTYPAYGFWMLAQEKGLAPDLEIEYQAIEDPFQTFSLATTGQLDVVSNTIEFAPISAAENMPVSLVAYANISYGVDKIIMAPGFSKASDLVGKKVAVLEGGLTQLYVAIWLEQNGVGYDQVEYVNLIMDDAVAAMLGGDVAAAEFWEPFADQVLNSGQNVRLVAQSKEDFWLENALLADGVYMTNAFIETRRDVAVKTMKALYDAIEWWRENPTEGNQIIANALKIPVSDVELVLGKDGTGKDGGAYPYTFIEAAQFCGSAPGNPPFGQKNGQIEHLWRFTNEWWIKFGLMSKEIDPVEGINCSLLTDLYTAGYGQ